MSEVLGKVGKKEGRKEKEILGIQKSCLLPSFSLSPFLPFEKCL